MLSTVNTSSKTRKAEYKALITDLESQLSELQRKALSFKIPVILLFEGWGAAGKGSQINRLLLSLDPRGVTVHSTEPPNKDERLRPFLWRFWTKTPARGRIAIFGRSWYGRFLVEDMDPDIKDLANVPRQAYEAINVFERQLVDDGYIVIKFFLHISAEAQEDRFQNLTSNPSTSWRVTEKDWKKHEEYDHYYKLTDKMLEKTSTPHAPWTVIATEDRRWGTLRVFEAVIDRISKGIFNKTQINYSSMAVDDKPRQKIPNILGSVDLNKELGRTEYSRLLKLYQNRVRDLEHEIYRQRLPVVVVYEGWDAAGKGGNIKRLVSRMDPRGYEVI
ncbi:MAG: phosphate--AMP phosphotransferase, partial [Candidatus Latescibacterota bacterium]|nr:phosphate--AMP phosphotransferase [Candidatus Latescibacterota bacterium]